MDFRFVAYDPQTGAKLYQMPRANSVKIGDTFGTRGTLELTYSAKAVNARDLPTFLEVQAEVTFDEGDNWAPAGPSLLRLSGSHEDTDQAGMRTLQFVGREWLLNKARVGAGDLELIDGKRPFYQASPGQILRTLILEAQDRGAADGLEIGNFTAAKDSSGNAWSKVATIYYSPGLPIGSVLENLVEQGMCDYRMNGRTIELFDPETTMGRDLTTGNNPVRVHGAVTEAPVKYTLEDLANSALLMGDEGFELEVDNPTAPDDYGRLEVTIEQGGVSDSGTARLMVDEALQRGSREVREITRSQSAAGAAFLPFRDYRVGDYVQVHTGGAWERYRVREIQLARDGQEWTIHTVINDRLQELLLKLAKRTSGIVNGTTGSGGDGTRPAPAPQPGIEPAAPEGLVIDQQVYLDRQGIARGAVTAGWGAVTESTKGTAVEIGGYELWWRENETLAVWRRASSVVDSLTVTHSPVVLSDTFGNAMEYQWCVRAIAEASARPGPWSDSVTLTMTQDTEPPNMPSTPAVSTDLRIVMVDIDGLDEFGESLPIDYNHHRIYFAAAEDMAGADMVGTLSNPGSWNSGSMDPDVPVWVAVSAVDNVGNESPMTPPQAVTPRKLVDDESIRDELGTIDDKISTAVNDLEQGITVAEARALEEARELADMARRAGSNLIVNGSFENGSEGWSREDGSITEDVTARDGIHILHVAASSINQYPQSESIDTRPGAVYHVEYWVRRKSGGSNPSVLRFFVSQEHSGGTASSVYATNDAGSINLAQGSSLTEGVWTKVSGTVAIIDPEVVSIRMGPHITASGTAYDIDSVNAIDATQARDALDSAKADASAKDAAIKGEMEDVVDGAVDDLESQINVVRTSIDGKNSITQSVDAPPSQYTGAVGDRWERMSSMGSGGLLVSNWRWNGSVWVSTLISDAVLGNVSAAKIVAGEMEGARIKAGTITADRLVVGVSQNLVVDPKFKNNQITTARSTAVWKPVESGHETWMGNGGTQSIRSKVLYLTTSGGATPAENRLFIDRSTKWAVSVEIFVGPGADPIQKFYFSAAAYRPDGTPAYLTSLMTTEDGVETVTPDDGWVTLHASVDWSVYSEDYVSVAPRMFPTVGGEGGGWYYLRNPHMAEMVGTTVISDGAVTTDKILAGAVKAGSIDAGAIEAEHISVGAVVADAIAADAVTAEKVQADAIGAEAIAAGVIDAGHIIAGGIEANSLLIAGSVGSTLIEDGAITTDKILANAITAGKIAALAIEADHISANAITADKINAGAIDGKLITGARIRTSASGARVELNSEGLKAYRSNGDVVLNTDTSDGSIDMTGNLSQTRGDVTMTVGQAFAGSNPGIRWNDANGYRYSPGIAYSQDGSRDYVYIQAPGTTTGNAYLSIDDSGNGFDLNSYSSQGGWRVTADNPGGSMRVGSRDSAAPYLSFQRGTGSTGQAFFGYRHPSNGGYSSLVLRDRYVWLGAHDSSGNVVSRLYGDDTSTELSAGTRKMSVRGGDGAYMNFAKTSNGARVQSGTIYSTTSDGGYSVRVNSSGTLFSESSSLRYKQDVATARELPSILDVEPKIWRNKSSMENHRKLEGLRAEIGEGPVPQSYAEAQGDVPWDYGAVAEEVDGLGLSELVVYDPFGRPDALNYEKFGVALIPIIRRLRDRVDVLEQQLGATA